MDDKRAMRTLERLRRFVDWDLKRKPITTAGNLTLLIGMLPWLMLAATKDKEGSPAFSMAFFSALLFDAAWFGYVGWRAWLVFRQAAARGDRIFDRKGKFDLPPEYAGSESATKARSRRRRNGS